MKKSIILFVFSLFALSAGAQIPGAGIVTKKLPKPLFGIKVGGNFNELSTSASALAKAYKPSFLPGVFVGLRKGDWGLRLEAIINTAKYDYTFKDINNNPLTSGTFSNVYLDLPLMLEHKLWWRLWVQGGLQFSQTLSVKSIASGNYQPIKSPSDLFQNNSYSGVLGVEARLPVHLVLGARYILGFTDLKSANLSNAYSNASSAWNARTAQIYVGFRFI